MLEGGVPVAASESPPSHPAAGDAISCRKVFASTSSRWLPALGLSPERSRAFSFRSAPCRAGNRGGVIFMALRQSVPSAAPVIHSANKTVSV